ncbi:MULTISPECIES: flagellar export chaperone FliS [Pseudomonas]|jgi:flagellar protein FliS|uniref:flagellar export chaperone FliS n=1 Tax=Pseudomonas aeruginosa group TaxID=136841 RepID=UPI000853AC6C|nr:MULTISPECIES: flagellar export chaperone FliS [Pseudomonas]
MNAMAALRQYQNVNASSQVHDASPHRLIQMLMETGLGRLAQARGAMERGQFAQKGMLIAKGLGIIGGLREAINLEAGGELAQNYANLYDYMTRRLTEASRDNDVAILDEVTDLLRTLKEGWDGIAS